MDSRPLKGPFNEDFESKLTTGDQGDLATKIDSGLNAICAHARLLCFTLQDPGRASHTIPFPMDGLSRHQINIDWQNNNLGIEITGDSNCGEFEVSLRLPYEGYSLSVSVVKHGQSIFVDQIKENCDVIRLEFVLDISSDSYLEDAEDFWAALWAAISELRRIGKASFDNLSPQSIPERKTDAAGSDFYISRTLRIVNADDLDNAYLCFKGTRTESGQPENIVFKGHLADPDFLRGLMAAAEAEDGEDGKENSTVSENSNDDDSCG